MSSAASKRRYTVCRCLKPTFLSEAGLDIFYEVGVGFAILIAYVEEALKRGLKVDDFAPRLSYVSITGMDFLEEIAKLRAIRRMWAKLLNERWKAKDPRSLRVRIAVHSAGSSLVPQEPMNNVVRATCEVLSAVLGGCQAVEACSYDEPVCLPSAEGHRLALRTQQIISYETGITKVSDPLGGSYYIESLTNAIEDGARRVMEEIDKVGGIKSALTKGWVEARMDETSLKVKRETEERKRIIVAVNAFTQSETQGEQVQPFRATSKLAKEHIESVRQLKSSRENKKVSDALGELYRIARCNENLISAVVDAYLVYATQSEVLGTLRQAYGLPYDPFEQVLPPFRFAESH